MKKLLLALAGLLFLGSAASAQTCQNFGTKVRGVNDLVELNRNANNNVLAVTPADDGLCAGTYHFCGNWTLEADAPGTPITGLTFANKHADIGLNPLSIDTAPAGGAAHGDHIPLPGDNSILTIVLQTGCRILTVDGTQNVYLHIITNWTPENAVAKGGGALNWHKIQ